jgi:hypothetical protein
MMKMGYQSMISLLRQPQTLTMMGMPVMKNGVPSLQVALLHLLISTIVTPSWVFFMTQLKPLETA